MKIKLVLVSILFLLISTAFAQTFSLGVNSTSVGSDSGITSISITSDTYWGVYNIPSWITVDTTWYNGSKTLTISYTTNPYLITRTASLSFYYLDKNWQYAGGATLDISQSASTSGISDSILTIKALAGSLAAFNIKTDNYWEVDDLPSWLSINNNWQWIGQTLFLTATENQYSTSRSCYITVYRLLADSSYISAKIKVIQLASENGISASPLFLGSGAGSNVGFSVSSKTSWTVSTKSSWISLNKSSSQGNDSIYLTAKSANTMIQYRVDTVIVSFSNGQMHPIVVMQYPQAAFANPDTSNLNFAGADSSSASLSISSNTNWGLISFPLWMYSADIYGYGDSALTIYALQNPYTVSRKSSIYMYWLDGYGNFVNDTTITLTQSASTYGISDSVISIGATAGSTANLSIVTDNYWEIDDIPSWLGVSKNYTSGNATITITAQANPTTNNREGTLTINRLLPNLKYLSTKIKVIQSPSSTGVSSNIVTVSYSEGSSSIFSVTSLLSWTLSGSKSWLSVSSLSGTSGKNSVSVKASANPTIYYRTDTLLISYSDGTTSTVVVIQSPAPAQYVFSPSSFVLSSTANSPILVSITSNTSWGFSNIPSWLSASLTSGYADGLVTFTAVQNTQSATKFDSLLTYWFDQNNEYHSQWIPVIQKGTSIIQTISLTKGWNLISLNVLPSDSSISSIFGNSLQYVLEIKDDCKMYNSTNKLTVFNSLTTLAQGKAYLVNMKQASVISITAIPSIITTKQLKSCLKYGWNYVGYPFQTTNSVNTIFNTSTYPIIKNLQSFYINGGTTNTLSNLSPSSGYFINKK